VTGADRWPGGKRVLARGATRVESAGSMTPGIDAHGEGTREIDGRSGEVWPQASANLEDG